MTYAGEIAALVTAGCWAVTALAFEAAGGRIGSMVVNLLRLGFGLAALCLYGWIARGQALPLDATGHAWGWLAVSAVAGLVIGDMCLFRAFIELGPRLSSLIMASSPVFAAILGYVGLAEGLAWVDVAGVTAVSVGIGWALWSRPTPGRRAVPPPTARGVLLAFGGAVGQAAGLVLSKHGMGDYDPFAATQIRLAVGLAVFVALFSLAGWWPRVIAALGQRRALGFTALGSVFGPFLGVSLSLYAIQHTDTGVAASLMATTPLVILPMVIARGERVGIGGVAGAAIAVAGVALLLS